MEIQQEEDKKRPSIVRWIMLGAVVVLLICVGAWAAVKTGLVDISPYQKLIVTPTQTTEQTPKTEQPKAEEPATPQKPTGCGNRQVDKGEDFCNCREDFMWKADDGVCDPWEDYRFTGDCPKYIVDICGNGRCEPVIGETAGNCAKDCAGNNVRTFVSC